MPGTSTAQRWRLPDGDCVLHVAHEPLGTLIEREIETQARSQGRLGYRVLGRGFAEAAEPQPHWLDASEWPGVHRTGSG